MREQLGENLVEKKANAYKERRRLIFRWAYTVAFLAVFVVVGVGASLRHYGQAKTNVDRIYVCDFEVHEHTDECYEDGKLICGMADYYIHRHNDDCYNDLGELICLLEEKSTHDHTDDCYREIKTLVCGFYDDEDITSENTTDAKTDVDKDSLENEENKTDDEIDKDTDDEDEDLKSDEEDEEDEDSKSNDKDSDDEESDNADEAVEADDDNSNSSEDTSDESVSESEVTTSDEVEATETLSGDAGDSKEESESEVSDEADEDEENSESDAKEKHVHTDECYKIERVLICEEEELHTHDDRCFDSEGKCICGELEVIEHVHTKACFEFEDAMRSRSIKKRYYAETEHVKVTAIVPGNAGIPEEAEFRVFEVEEDENTKNCEESVEDMDGVEDYAIAYLLDIGFYIGDDEIEPEAEVEIQIEAIDEDLPLEDDTEIVHFKENDENQLDAERIVDKEVEDGKVTFVSDSFSIYAILTKKGLTTINPDNTVRNNFYNTPYYDSSSALGLYGNFHALAFDDFTVSVHCAGNIAARRVYAKANFANQDMYGKARVSYIQMFRDISESCGSGNGDSLILGSGHTFTTTSNRVFTKDRLNVSRAISNVSYVSRDNNTDKNPYIDLVEAKREAAVLSDNIKEYCLSAGNTNITITNDGDQRKYVNIKDTSKPAIWNVKVSELNINDYLRINGLKPSGAYIIINLDCENQTDAYVNAKVYSSFDSNYGRDPKTGARILWNLYNCYGKTIHFNKEVIPGTILAPDSNVIITAQLEGAVVAKSISISCAESHFYPYTGNVPEKTSLTVKKVWENVPVESLGDYSVDIDLYRTTTATDYSKADKSEMDKVSSVTISKNNNWTYTFTNLPYSSGKGSRYYYYAFENKVNKKGKDVTKEFDTRYETACDGTQKIVNRNNQLTVGFDATKLVDGVVPNDKQVFKFKLYLWDNQSAKWLEIDKATNNKESIHFDHNISWYYHNITYYFYLEEDLSSMNIKYEGDKTGYIYAVTKLLSDDYTKVEVKRYKTKDGVTKESFYANCKFENIYKHADETSEIVFNNTTKETSIEVKKQWRNMASVTKPARVEIKLYQADKQNAPRESWIDTGKTLTITEETYWIAKFEKLPLFDDDGKDIFYYIEESAIVNYQGNTEDGFYIKTYSNNEGVQEGQIVVTNTHEKIEEKTEILVKKNWYDTELKNTSQSGADSIDFRLWRTKTITRRRIDAADKDSADIRDVTLTVAGNMKPYKLSVCNGDTVVLRTDFFYDYCNLEKYGNNDPEKFKAFLKNMSFNYPTDIQIVPKERRVTYTVSIPITASTGKDISILSNPQKNGSNWYWDLKYVFIANKVSVDDILCNGSSVMDREVYWEEMGTYTLSKNDNFRLLIEDLPLMVTENEVTTSYVYGVEEIVPENATYKLLGYFPDIEGYHENITEGDFAICNMINNTEITVEKEWYTRDGERVGDLEATEVSINVQVYQTKSKDRPQNPDGDVLVGEYILQRQSVSKVYQNDEFKNVKVSTVKAVGYDVIDEWKFKLSGLPNCDANRNMYYYYVVETKIGERATENSIYEQDYGEGDKAITNNGTLVIKNYGTETFDFLPSTGGRGTINYWIKKWFKDLLSLMGAKPH